MGEVCCPAGAGEIFISNSSDLLKWELGEPFITHTSWGNPNVEAGPPPMRLADGNYVGLTCHDLAAIWAAFFSRCQR